MKKIIPLALFMVGMLPGLANAAIVGLFNTGIGLPNNDPDLNYEIISGPITGLAIVATSAGLFPIPPWTPDSATSAWIAPSEDTFGPVGTYTYRTTFNVTGDPATNVINGDWSTDNRGVDILINDISLGFTTSVNSFSTPFEPFSINSGFVLDENTLDFVVNNFGGPTGLRVELAASVIPIPATIWLFGSGLLGLLALGRNKTA